MKRICAVLCESLVSYPITFHVLSLLKYCLGWWLHIASTVASTVFSFFWLVSYHILCVAFLIAVSMISIVYIELLLLFPTTTISKIGLRVAPTQKYRLRIEYIKTCHESGWKIQLYSPEHRIDRDS